MCLFYSGSSRSFWKVGLASIETYFQWILCYSEKVLIYHILGRKIFVSINVTFIEDESYFVNLYLKREINESENILLVSSTPLLNPELELVGANQGERKAMKGMWE